MHEENLQDAAISDELKAEIEMFRVLKPFIAHCLKLNHDLNNPLAGIIGYTEFLMMDEDHLTEDQCSNIKRVMQCAERIQGIIDDLCARKMEMGEKTDLRALVDHFVKD